MRTTAPAGFSFPYEDFSVDAVVEASVGFGASVMGPVVPVAEADPEALSVSEALSVASVLASDLAAVFEALAVAVAFAAVVESAV